MRRKMTQAEAYDEVVRIARENALIWQAYGGVVVIVHPDTQKEQGIYSQIQWAHGLGPHPGNIEGD